MLARRTVLTHPTAGPIELPLLVPSFSSKGFGLIQRRGKNAAEYSSVAYELAEFGQFPTRSVLISAYDLHYRHLEAPDVKPRSPLSHLHQTGVVFLDSGGYELAGDYDSSEIRRSPYAPKDGYGPDEYVSVLRNILKRNKAIPLIVTNADWSTRRLPLKDQISAARALFQEAPGCVSDFIIKPGKGRSVVEPDSISKADYQNLTRFDIIGVTEKELGRNLKDRLKRIAGLRMHLDEAGIQAPIHIWGGLDPVLTPLFFFAGAEIFDGVSWLRYAFRHGVALNRECNAILDENLRVGASAALAQRMTSILNLQVMENIESSLRAWVDLDGETFDMFDRHVKEQFRHAFADMVTWNSALKGGH